MPKVTLPQVITPKDLTEFFEEKLTAIIGKKVVRFSDRPGDDPVCSALSPGLCADTGIDIVPDILFRKQGR